MGVKQATEQRIYAICEKRGIVPNKLANQAGITPSTLYSILDPGRKDIGIVAIKKLCDGLDMSLSEFFDDPIFDNLEQEIQ